MSTDKWMLGKGNAEGYFWNWRPMVLITLVLANELDKNRVQSTADLLQTAFENASRNKCYRRTWPQIRPCQQVLASFF